MSEKLARRSFLKGLGTLMAVPLLESAAPLAALAEAVKPPPVRVAFLFVPNGVSMEHWTPSGAGSSFELPELLQPLEGLRKDFSIISGLAQNGARALGDGPGDHARSAAAWLTGVHPKKTAGADIRNGISADQLAAQALGKETRFASLELGCERSGLAGDCDSGYSCAYSSSIAWRGEATPVPKETNPRLVFERLFGGEDAELSAEARLRRLRYKQSILDMVLEDARSLKGKVGYSDRLKLDEYLSSVREIEQRLLKFESSAKISAAAKVEAPGQPQSFGEHIRLMGDMMILAFQTDLTRVATFMLANEGSNRSYAEIGVADGHHDVSHHGKNAEKLEKKKKIDLFHTQQLAYILGKMKSTKEAGGSLLDNTVLIYGGGIGDGDRHNHDDLPILVAGKGGGRISQGKHLQFSSETPMTNLLISALDVAGVRAERLGDSTGRLKQLF